MCTNTIPNLLLNHAFPVPRQVGQVTFFAPLQFEHIGELLDDPIFPNPLHTGHVIVLRAPHVLHVAIIFICNFANINDTFPIGK